MAVKTELSNKNQIGLYMHCEKCLNERPPGISPMEWSRTQTGWTPLGLQVWCNRHNCNVVNIDFEGMMHPAEVTAADLDHGREN